MKETAATNPITVATTIQAQLEKVWQFWTEPRHIMQWNQASDDWHTPSATNDVRVGGRFLSRMEARDGSIGFDFTGTYTLVKEQESLAYTLEDGRKVEVAFAASGTATCITQTFEVEQTHSIEMQQAGWQATLDHFKAYAEASGKPVTLLYEIRIDAPAEKIYRTMLDQEQYAAWTAAFHPTSHYQGSWEKGATIRFLGTDEEGKTGGMVSRIKENIPNQFISIEHLGLVQHGVEITSGPEVDGWAGALENYTFTEEQGSTLLTVDVDTNQEFEAYFSETWPLALEKLKELCGT